MKIRIIFDQKEIAIETRCFDCGEVVRIPTPVPDVFAAVVGMVRAMFVRAGATNGIEYEIPGRYSCGVCSPITDAEMAVEQ